MGLDLFELFIKTVNMCSSAKINKYNKSIYGNWN